MVKQGQQTGACGVVITGHHRYFFIYMDIAAVLITIRSLVTTLRAAEAFDKSHLSSPEIVPLIQNAEFFYIGGFFLTHGVESALELAKTASGRGKVSRLALAQCSCLTSVII